ncbi:rCG41290, partial [Rattus norvegicus]
MILMKLRYCWKRIYQLPQRIITLLRKTMIFFEINFITIGVNIAKVYT